MREWGKITITLVLYIASNALTALALKPGVLAFWSFMFERGVSSTEIMPPILEYTPQSALILMALIIFFTFYLNSVFLEFAVINVLENNSLFPHVLGIFIIPTYAWLLPIHVENPLWRFVVFAVPIFIAAGNIMLVALIKSIIMSAPLYKTEFVISVPTLIWAAYLANLFIQHPPIHLENPLWYLVALVVFTAIAILFATRAAISYELDLAMLTVALASISVFTVIILL